MRASWSRRTRSDSSSSAVWIHAIGSAVWETVRDSTRLVGRPVFFSMAIILLAFIPVFALTGQEGKLFHPLAFTKTFAVLAATVIAVTLVPVLCTLLLGGKFHPEEDNPVMRGLRAVYRPVLQGALAHRALTIRPPRSVRGALVLARGIGSEFMPPLNEGDLMFMPIADPSISLEENTKIAARQNAALDEVSGSGLCRRQGRARRHLDGSGAAEHDRDHRPPEAEDEWRSGMTLDGLRAEMGRAVQLPGVSNIWTMPIINRIDMLTTGIRSEVGVKIFGTDLVALEGWRARSLIPSDRAGRQQRLPRTGDQRPVPEHRRRPRRRGALRHRCRGCPAGDRERHRGNHAVDDHRGP